MKYNPYEFDGVRTSEVQVTLQVDDYVGHIWHKFTGAKQGKQALGFDFKYCDCDEDIYRNDCELRYSQICDAFYAELEDDEGKKLKIEGESAEFMNRLITAVEITDCYKEKSCYTCDEWEPGFERCRHPDQTLSLVDDYMAPRDHCCDLWDK